MKAIPQIPDDISVMTGSFTSYHRLSPMPMYEL